MKANEFKSVLKSLIAEEVRKEVSKQLPKLLFEMVGQHPKTVVNESPASTTTRQQSVVQTKPAPTKQIKQYVKDPVLNAILNETTPGLPSTSFGDQGVPIPPFKKVGVSDEFIGEMKQILNESSDPSPNLSESTQPSTEEPPPGDLSRLFNKDFKAILEKSKGGHGGNFSKVIQNW